MYGRMDAWKWVAKRINGWAGTAWIQTMCDPWSCSKFHPISCTCLSDFQNHVPQTMMIHVPIVILCQRTSIANWCFWLCNYNVGQWRTAIIIKPNDVIEGTGSLLTYRTVVGSWVVVGTQCIPSLGFRNALMIDKDWIHVGTGNTCSVQVAATPESLTWPSESLLRPCFLSPYPP